jgi:hypothetical protein
MYKKIRPRDLKPGDIYAIWNGRRHIEYKIIDVQLVERKPRGGQYRVQTEGGTFFLSPRDRAEVAVTEADDD